MTDNKTVNEPQTDADEEEDVEGNNMWVASTVASDLARSRSKDLEREAKQHRRAKEAKQGR